MSGGGGRFYDFCCRCPYRYKYSTRLYRFGLHKPPPDELARQELLHAPILAYYVSRRIDARCLFSRDDMRANLFLLFKNYYDIGDMGGGAAIKRC